MIAKKKLIREKRGLTKLELWGLCIVSFIGLAFGGTIAFFSIG